MQLTWVERALCAARCYRRRVKQGNNSTTEFTFTYLFFAPPIQVPYNGKKNIDAQDDEHKIIADEITNFFGYWEAPG